LNGREIISQYEKFCPKELSMEGDTVGLQIGTLNKEVKKVLVTLDIRENTVQEAIEHDVDLILTKHAPIFRPLHNLAEDSALTKIVTDLVKYEKSVYVSHTNIDIVEGGLNDWLLEAIGVKVTGFLHQTHTIDGKSYGIGRVGKIEQDASITLQGLVEKVNTAFGLQHSRVVAKEPSRTVSTIAICGGSGEKFYKDALRQGVDVYITGDIYYHTAHDMMTLGLQAIDPGHHIERLFIEKITEKLNVWKADFGWDVEIIPSASNTNPFQLI
jgi:dinuclear metal center YbgI/SA1388 family protein